MATSLCNTSASNVFIDLATFSEMEAFLYGGRDAITHFVGAVQKANWFSFIPVPLRSIGSIDFGTNNVSACVNRSGDYVIHLWFRAQVPQIEIQNPNGDIFIDATIRWTRNLMHNLFEHVSITFNELCVQEFDNFWLDMNFQFRKRGSKRIGYRNQIGDIGAMTNPVNVGQSLGTGGFFSVPLPFWFTHDSGIALPTAALPFNDIKINYNLRRWQDLVVVFPGTAAAGAPGTRVATCNDVFLVGSNQKPTLNQPTTFAHYAVVHNDERVKMGDAPRDILIHQVQNTQYAPFRDVSTQSSFDVRLSHAIVVMCFAAQNVSLLSLGDCNGEWSNYTTEPNYAGLDPISFTQLVYENTTRLAQGSDYYSLILPDLLSKATPDESGYHMWTYALHPWNPLTPSGSTNYSKLANVSLIHNMSPAAQNAAGVGAAGVPVDQAGNLIQYPNSAGVIQNFPQRWNHILVVRNWNIIRVANGTLALPTL